MVIQGLVLAMMTGTGFEVVIWDVNKGFDSLLRASQHVETG